MNKIKYYFSRKIIMELKQRISDRYPDLKIPILRVIKIIRRLQSKAWNRRNTNNWIIQEITGHGHGISNDICNAIGIDPYDYKIGDN